MAAERIDVDRLDGVVWQRAWQVGASTIRLGETRDRRWVVWHSRHRYAYAYWDERAACDRVGRMLVGRPWVELEHAA